jgi:inner membrane protein
MDNLTHSLIGIVAGEVVARSTRPAEGGLAAGTRRGFLVTIGVIGGNLPDSDLIVSYSGFGRDKLAYLLQHRGYTHTILGCVILALLLYGAAELVARFRRLAFAREDRVALIGMALFGTLLHLAMDSLNSYGVHPFWPFNDEWFYGDSVFIVEPLYWIAAAPMFFLLRTIRARFVLAVALLGALVATVVTYSSVHPTWYIGVIIATALLLFVGKNASARTAAWTAAGAAVSVTAMFIAGGLVAARRAEAIVAQSFPSEQRVDHVLSPGFTNPFCFDVLMVQTGGGQYTVRHAAISSAPGVLPVNQCFGMLIPRRGTAPMTDVSARSSPAIHWIRQFSMPLDRLASLAAQDCEARELLQFARARYATQVGGEWVIGDLRFDRERPLGMAEIALGNEVSSCRFHVPWIAPRATLLEGQGGRRRNFGGSPEH